MVSKRYNKVVNVWKPISITQAWVEADTSKLDAILPSWERKRMELKEGDKNYAEFLNRLKRQHAIETGAVEKLYDLSEGLTQTFIKEGFVESYLQYGDTNIPPHKLLAHLKDHFEALDFVFDMVKNERPLTEFLIRALHQLITQNQDYTSATDSLGQTVQVKLLKGKYKEHPNNPQRADGTIYYYCPPNQVQSEMEELIRLYREELIAKEVHPIIIAAWVHHAFTQIHPFQDGNGRVARVLASLILIQAGLFPLTIRRIEKTSILLPLKKRIRNIPMI